MIISELYIRGFKSFGHNIQKLNFDTECGKLCLLVGKNGHGKSSLINSIEFTAYKKSRGRTKKWSPLSSLPNRHNRELLTGIKFKSKGVEVEVIRGINPDKFELIEDGILNPNPIKYDNIIENYIGMDVNAFRSFISLSVNDFKNFISLNTEEKQLLLDKLFNLESVSQMGIILKDLVRLNKSETIKNSSEIATLEKSIIKMRNTIDLMNNKSKVVDNDINGDIISLEALVDDLKPLYVNLREKSKKIKEKSVLISSDMNNIKNPFNKLSNELINVDNEIHLYDSGKCPTCLTGFDSEYFLDLKDSLFSKKIELEKLLSELKTSVQTLRNRKQKLVEIKAINDSNFKVVVDKLNDYTSQINVLRQSSEKSKKVDFSDFENTITDLKTDLEKTKQKNIEFLEKEKCYIEMSKIFGEDGIRKTIISSIIDPINGFIRESMEVVNLPFDIKMDESFNAIITQWGTEIDHDTLSTGENRLVNIAILIAYLKLIRSKRNINVLFLDEIFSSIDVDGVDILLKLLSDFAKEYKINIFVVHHAIVSEDFFDRIIKLEKNMFTNIINYK